MIESYATYWITWTCLQFLFLFWNRLGVWREEKLPPAGQGFIIAANHASYMDPPVVATSIARRLTFLAKARLFDFNRFFAIYIRLLGAIPVASELEFRSLRTAVRVLKAGGILLMFPEGTRSGSGELLEPKLGVAFLAHAAGVPVAPCYIDGTGRALPRGKRWLRPYRVRVFYDRLYWVDGSKHDPQWESPEAFYAFHARRIMERIEALRQKFQPRA